MKIIDMHCDTMSCLLDSGESIMKNSCHIDAARMSEYDGYMQFFAAFLAPEYRENGKKRVYDIIDKFYRETANDGIESCHSFADAEFAVNNGSIAAFLSVEGADFIKSAEDVYELYDKGVRCMTLTWNYSNALASGVLDTTADFGLTPLGREVVRAMNRCGIILDVSHLSDKAFYDAAEVCEKPFIASHSNLRSVCKNPRNLTDEQFKIICQSGGGVGINLYPPFLNESGRANTDDIKRHIDLFLTLGGENHIGLGCDFDGVDCLPEKINSCADIKGALYENLKCFLDETVIFKMFYANFERILYENL